MSPPCHLSYAAPAATVFSLAVVLASPAFGQTPKDDTPKSDGKADAPKTDGKQDAPTPPPQPLTNPEAKPAEPYRDQLVAEVHLGDGGSDYLELLKHSTITLHDLELRARLSSDYRDLTHSQPDNKTAIRKSLRRQLDTLIEERLLLQMCVKEKITLTKEDEKHVERQIERTAEPYGGIDGLKTRLSKDLGVPYDYFAECKRTNLLMSRLISKNVRATIYVEPERIRKYYEENKRTEFRRDAVTKFYQIDIYKDLGSSRVPNDVKRLLREWNPDVFRDKAETRLEDLWNAAAARRFADHVRGRLEKDPTAWREIAIESTMNAAAARDGGLMQVAGDKPLGDQMGLLGEAADKLKPSEVSPVIESRLGFHIICMKQRSVADVLPFSEVQHEIYNKLTNEIWQERLRAWIGKIRDEAIITDYLPPE